MEKNVNHPSQRLVRLRKILGLSQQELANEFKVTYGAVGSWESGAQEISVAALRLLEIYEESYKSPSFVLEDEILADELVDTFSNSTHITDARLLGRLKHSLSQYVRNDSETPDLRRHIRGLAMKQLIRTLADSRGLAMKVAQISAFLDPNIPDDLRETIGSLQYQNRSMPYQRVCEIFIDEFGKEPHQLFLEFSRRPVAAASIGQVHRARLFNGTWVAVKIQYPEIKGQNSTVLIEPKFMDQLAQFLGGEPKWIEDVLQDFQETVLAECDFEQEAKIQDFYSQLFESDEEILVPKVFFTYSSKQILTTQWVDGQSWHQFKNGASQEDRNRACQIISRFYAHSAFVHSLIHADPHPGNYLFCKGKVAFLDYGRVRRLSARFQEEFSAFHRIILDQDRDKMKSFLAGSETIRPRPNFNFLEFWDILVQISQHLTKTEDMNFSRDILSAQRNKLKKLAAFVTVQPDFFWAFLFVHQLLSCGRADLGATANWGRIVKENLASNLS
jgi:predicted unusual protein kinase regulating ubiquinone biosynthesis (AarF/ABC1/UbiB family)/DNA-binding XRE family transcriptional regulator